MSESSDNVRKAAEEILRCSTGWLVPASQSIKNDAARKMVEEMISRHCHVTEMEAVVEKCEKAVRSVDSYFRKHKIDATPDAAGLWIAVSNALSSIDALKGDKR